MSTTVYFPGGFDPTMAQSNRAELWDSDAGTYTRWDRDGSVAETRPFTADELAAAQAPTIPSGELAVDRYTVPADGQTYAVARYGATDAVHFVIDGQVATVQPENGVAELEMAADAAGPITVQVRDRSFVIVAEAL